MTLRGFNNLVQAVVVLILVAFIWRLISLLAADANHLGQIAMALCAIVGLFVAGVIAMNVGRVQFKADKDGVEGDVGEGGNAGS